MYNSRYGAIAFLVSTSIKVVLDIIFASSQFSRFIDSTHFQKCWDHENIGQDHEVQYSLLCHSMDSINFYNSCLWAFFTSSHRFPDIFYLYISRYFVTLKIWVKVTMYNILSGSILMQKHDFLSYASSNDYSVSHRLRDIHKTNKISEIL